VLQDPLLFGGTIAETIRYGRLEATLADIRAAASAAHADEFIVGLEHGYDTVVAENGRGLSGGERQRLSVARALLKAAPVLILDEPTSSLDAISEGAVFAALSRGRERRTTLVIAHRLSTVRNADRILLLDGGTIAAQGTHTELLASSELYRQMCTQLAVDPAPVPDLAGMLAVPGGS
jgi:ABC-type multidrug transport system fused ATPase/permease subunit